jgi:hypothetical protein
MPALVVVVFKKLSQPGAQFTHRAIFPQKDVLPFDRPPEPLDKDVVKGPTSPIQAHADAARLQSIQPLRAGELAALVGIVNFRLAARRPRPLSVATQKALSIELESSHAIT